MGPGAGGEPTGTLGDKMKEAFGSYDDFKSQFSAAAARVFGSGWAWLAVAKDGSVKIVTTPNQDNPLMEGATEAGLIPIMGESLRLDPQPSDLCSLVPCGTPGRTYWSGHRHQRPPSQASMSGSTRTTSSIRTGVRSTSRLFTMSSTGPRSANITRPLLLARPSR